MKNNTFLVLLLVIFLSNLSFAYATVLKEKPAWITSGTSFTVLSGGKALNCQWTASGAKNITDLILTFNIIDFKSRESSFEFDFLSFLKTLDGKLDAQQDWRNLLPKQGGFLNEIYFTAGSHLLKFDSDLSKPSLNIIYSDDSKINTFRVFEDFWLIGKKNKLLKLTRNGKLIDELTIKDYRSGYHINYHEKSKRVSIAYSNASNQRIFEFYSYDNKFKKIEVSENEYVLGVGEDLETIIKNVRTKQITIKEHNSENIIQEFDLNHLPIKLGNCEKVTSDENYYYLFFTSYEYSEVLKIEKITGLITQRIGSNIDWGEIVKNYCNSNNTNDEGCKPVGNFSFQYPYLICESKLYNIQDNWKIANADFPRITMSNLSIKNAQVIETSNSTIDIIGQIVSAASITQYEVEKVRDKNDISYLNEENISRDTINFSTKIELSNGVNVIKIRATDALFNETIKHIKIKKLLTKSRGSIATGQSGLKEKIESFDYKALLISNQYYNNGVNNLEFPTQDANKLKAILLNDYSFEEKNIFHLKNATRADIINALDSLTGVVTQNDNLLIFYAGHGVFDENLKKGYWLPVDADPKRKTNWVSNSDIQDYLVSFQSQHTLLISDACFSGSIFEFNQRKLSDKNRKITSRLLEKKSRKAMTSGLNKPVPDESKFIKYLLKELENNTKSYLTAGQLFYEIREAVRANTENDPQFEIIKNADHEGGEFVFFKSEQ